MKSVISIFVGARSTCVSPVAGGDHWRVASCPAWCGRRCSAFFMLQRGSHPCVVLAVLCDTVVAKRVCSSGGVVTTELQSHRCSFPFPMLLLKLLLLFAVAIVVCRNRQMCQLSPYFKIEFHFISPSKVPRSKVPRTPGNQARPEHTSRVQGVRDMPTAPLVFLDVDGVLHPLIVELRDGKLCDEHCFGAECMRQLKRIVDGTGAEIVLSSSWRQFEEPRRRLAAALASHGLSFRQWYRPDTHACMHACICWQSRHRGWLLANVLHDSRLRAPKVHLACAAAARIMRVALPLARTAPHQDHHQPAGRDARLANPQVRQRARAGLRALGGAGRRGRDRRPGRHAHAGGEVRPGGAWSWWLSATASACSTSRRCCQACNTDLHPTPCSLH